MPTKATKVLSKYRRRLKRGGIVRVEMNLRKDDAALLTISTGAVSPIPRATCSARWSGLWPGMTATTWQPCSRHRLPTRRRRVLGCR